CVRSKVGSETDKSGDKRPPPPQHVAGSGAEGKRCRVGTGGGHARGRGSRGGDVVSGPSQQARQFEAEGEGRPSLGSAEREQFLYSGPLQPPGHYRPALSVVSASPLFFSPRASGVGL
ncbi:hypothetical protein BaRGS_00026888, partial [Batillaria attramentaria]